MARIKQFDSRYAPKNWRDQATAGSAATEKHLQDVLADLEPRLHHRSQEFRNDAVQYVQDWAANHPDGFIKDSPANITTATILAVSIRRSARERSQPS